jgi:uncharacterized MAPEG superfamily protein
MGSTATALVGFAGWYVLLTFVLAFYRVYVSASTGKGINTFSPDGSDTPGIGQRLTRARDNCFETLPLFAVIALGAQIAGRLDVTDGLALWVLVARLGQSITHVISIAPAAVLLRATFFTVQLLIYAWWVLQLLG